MRPLGSFLLTSVSPPLMDYDQHLAKTRQDTLESLISLMMSLQQLVLRSPHQTVRVPATQALP